MGSSAQHAGHHLSNELWVAIVGPYPLSHLASPSIHPYDSSLPQSLLLQGSYRAVMCLLKVGEADPGEEEQGVGLGPTNHTPSPWPL